MENSHLEKCSNQNRQTRFGNPMAYQQPLTAEANAMQMKTHSVKAA
jgi:hypothetical protein